MYLVLQIMVVTGLLLVAQEALRRATPWAVWSLFLLLPLILTPYWMEINQLGVFSWFKFYTVFFCVCWGAALRFTPLGNRAWARRTIPLLLAVNIAEAVILDLFGQGSGHLLNAVAGMLLIATLPYGQGSTQIDSASDSRDMLYATGEPWVIGYTIWNWTFVYLNYPSLTGHHTAVLAAGLTIALIAPGRWAQTRASTLGVSLLLTATDFNGMVDWMDTSSWFDQRAALVAAGLGVLFMSCCAMSSWLPQIAWGVPVNRPRYVATHVA